MTKSAQPVLPKVFLVVLNRRGESRNNHVYVKVYKIAHTVTEAKAIAVAFYSDHVASELYDVSVLPMHVGVGGGVRSRGMAEINIPRPLTSTSTEEIINKALSHLKAKGNK
jgi:hypothetical protein